MRLLRLDVVLFVASGGALSSQQPPGATLRGTVGAGYVILWEKR